MVKCSNPQCENVKPNFIKTFLYPSQKGIIREGKWFCSKECYIKYLTDKAIQEKKDATLKSDVEFTRRIGDILIDSGVLTPAQMKRALNEQKECGEKIGKILVQMGLVKPDAILKILSQQSGVPYIDLNKITHIPPIAETIPLEIIKNFKLLPFEFNKDEKFISIAISEPYDVRILRPLFEELFEGFSIKFFLGDENKIVEILKTLSPDLYVKENGVFERRIIEIITFLKEKGAEAVKIEAGEKKVEIKFKLDDFSGVFTFFKNRR